MDRATICRISCSWSVVECVPPAYAGGSDNMRKFLAVVKHEYKKIVVKWTFLLGTLLFPILGACFALVPALIFSIKGEPTRIIIVDPTNKIAPRLKSDLTQDKIAEKTEYAVNSSNTLIASSQDQHIKMDAEQAAEGFIVVDYDSAGRSQDQVRREL